MSNIDNLTSLLKYEPLDWQAKVRESSARFKVIAVGRRGGKSYFVTRDTKCGLVSDLCKKNKHVWIVAPNYDLTQRVWDELMILVQDPPFNDIIKRINNTKGWYRLETYLGTVIEAKSADEPEKLVGVGLTKLIVDEAGLVKKRAWTQSLRPTLIDFKGEGIFISTPKAKNWFYDIYLKGIDPDEKDWESWNFSSMANTKLPEGELNSIVKDMPTYEYNQEILAQFNESEEQVFRDIKKNIEGEFIKGDPETTYRIGIDLGRKSSYSVITVINEKTHHVDFIDRFRIVGWKLQVQRIKSIYEEYPCPYLRVDATGVGDPVVEDLIGEGLPVEPFIYGETSKKQLIDKLSISVDKSRITYPNYEKLIFEMERFGRKTSDSGKVKYRGMSGATDDCVNSLALANWDLAEYSPEADKPITFPTQTF